MSSKTYDVVIIGAGIVGSACAAECANEGLTVAIVESGIIGGGATAAGMGHLTVMDDSEAQFALTRYSQQLWDEISDELPREVEHDACGTGTSAKLACLFADGKLHEGQVWKQESIVGSVFEGTIKVVDNVVHPRIKGSAFITAEADLLLDARDPFAMGIGR